MVAFVDQIIKDGAPWTDPDFPPEMQSLADEDDDSQNR
jgi:hypothetical protein